MLSTHETAILSREDQASLLAVAGRSIEMRLQQRPISYPMVGNYSCLLQRVQSSFVTLRGDERLLSRAGTVEPSEPLVCDVSHNAYEAAGHRMQRIPPSQLTFEISIVSPLRCLAARSREAVLKCLEPGKHGVLLQEGQQNATFVPEKWDVLPEPIDFLRSLREHAGLDPDDWSPTTHVSTYTVQRLGPSRVA